MASSTFSAEAETPATPQMQTPSSLQHSKPALKEKRKKETVPSPQAAPCSSTPPRLRSVRVQGRAQPGPARRHVHLCSGGRVGARHAAHAPAALRQPPQQVQRVEGLGLTQTLQRCGAAQGVCRHSALCGRSLQSTTCLCSRQPTVWPTTSKLGFPWICRHTMWGMWVAGDGCGLWVQVPQPRHPGGPLPAGQSTGGCADARAPHSRRCQPRARGVSCVVLLGWGSLAGGTRSRAVCNARV